ncbi:MAG: hypothetical protein V1664_03220 [Candidatus Uhrbacteria bacterium]
MSIDQEQKRELPEEVISRVVEVLAEKFPLEGLETELFAKFSVENGSCSNFTIDEIVKAVGKETGLGYLEIAQNEKRIFPAYLTRIGYPTKK